jgi:hypothetical protein
MKRMYPSYTVSELQVHLTNTDLDRETRTKIEKEVEARLSGASVQFVTPQVAWK